MWTIDPHWAIPHTDAVQRVLSGGLPDSAVADLIFLEAWERNPIPGVAAARRVGQIRRAQPALAAAIRAELARHLPASPLQ